MGRRGKNLTRGTLIDPKKDRRRRKTPQTEIIDPNHVAFVDEFLANGMNGISAYRKVYPEAGYSAAGTGAHRLLCNEAVRLAIEQKLAANTEAANIRRARLVAKMNRIDDFNVMAASKDPEGSGTGLFISKERYDEVAEMIGDCVSNLEYHRKFNEDGEVIGEYYRLELMSKDKNFDRLLKYHGLVDLKGNVNVNVVNNTINWSQLRQRPDEPDEIEAKIEEVRKLPVIKKPVSDNEESES